MWSIDEIFIVNFAIKLRRECRVIRLIKIIFFRSYIQVLVTEFIFTYVTIVLLEVLLAIQCIVISPA